MKKNLIIKLDNEYIEKLQDISKRENKTIDDIISGFINSHKCKANISRSDVSYAAMALALKYL